jgi:hypothetical protein
MRAILLGLLFTIGCATTNPKFVNVAAVRNNINDTISHDAAGGQTTSRYIVSMGHTTNDLAVVYTQTSKTSPRREETWVKGSAGWQLKEAKDVSDGGSTSAASAN